MLGEDPSIIHLLLRYNCNCNSIRNTLYKSDRDTCIRYMGVYSRYVVNSKGKDKDFGDTLPLSCGFGGLGKNINTF